MLRPEKRIKRSQSSSTRSEINAPLQKKILPINFNFHVLRTKNYLCQFDVTAMSANDVAKHHPKQVRRKAMKWVQVHLISACQHGR